MEKEINKTLIDKLRAEISRKARALRREHGWTQKELARLLDLSQNRLSEIESGQGSFSAEQLILMLKLFGVSIEEMVELEGKAETQLQQISGRQPHPKQKPPLQSADWI